MSSTSVAEAWAATNVMTTMATRFQGSEKYLGRDDRQLGSKLGDNAYELFTICPPSEALMLHFAQQQPTFIAVHDVGASASSGFLVELAKALRQPVQSLTVRQQGSGVQVALLRFIELPTPRGVPVRVYCTAVEADTAQRRQIAEALLAFSRLGVLLIQAPADHLVSAQLALLRDRLLTVPWPNRDLLLVPRTATAKLEDHALRLVDGTLVNTLCAEPAASTAGIWNAIHGAWSHLRAGPAESTQRAAAPPPAPVVTYPAGVPMTPRAFDTAQAAETAPVAASQGYDSYVRACAALRGAQAALVFDCRTRNTLALSSHGIDPSAWTLHLTATLVAARAMEDGLGGGGGGGEAGLEVVSTLDRHVVVLRTLPHRPDLGLALVFDKIQVNLMLLRAQLQRLDTMLDQ